MAVYDEFGLFHENIAEWELTATVPTVTRMGVAVDGLRHISALRFGDDEPVATLLHGGAQNAHTWDTVALALGLPLLVPDLPGHGHSDTSPYPHGAIAAHARDIAIVLETVLSGPRPLVGMSLGGLVSVVLASERPDLVSSLLLVDITPGVNADKTKHITAFVNGPKTFENFEELLQRTMAHNPTRSESSLRRGILHNAMQLDDGSWVWRHQRGAGTLAPPPPGDLWDRLGSLTIPVTLVRGMAAGSVVDDEDEAEFLRRVPHGAVIQVEGAGHSVQGDQPVILAGIIRDFLS